MGYGYIIGVCAVLFVLLTGGFGVMLWIALNRDEVKRSLLTHPRDRKKYRKCPTCHYDLRGIASEQCPECGQAFDKVRSAPPDADDLQTDAPQQ